MIVIVDYQMGNVGSIRNMLRRLGYAVEISANPLTLAQADKLILPGVGAFDPAMRQLTESGLAEVLTRRVEAGVPTLGVCLGMQLMTRRSDEGTRPGLGWVDAETRRFQFTDPLLKIPHMGWNTLTVRPEGLFFNLPDDARFYFVHSYFVACDDPTIVTAYANYGGAFAAAFQYKNLFGVQFHPEKSHRFGMHVYRNFAEL